MNIGEALVLQAGDIVAFVGAGGKTRSMFRLGDELVRAGWRVLSTTTTRIAQDELFLAPLHIGFGAQMRPPPTLARQLDEHRHVFVFTKLEANEKVRGLQKSWLDRYLAPLDSYDVMLIEADGSRRLPLKAPLPHEPAIPESAAVVVVVAGLDALNRPLTEEFIYGTEFITSLTGLAPGVPVTPELVATVLMHPQVGLKNIPAHARVIPLLNKATADNLPAARHIARLLLTNPRIERVLIGAVRENNPIQEMHRRVGAVILAAGESRRMGQPKMLLPWGEHTVIRHVVLQALAAQPHEVVVVAGRVYADIQAQLADLPVRVIFNPNYQQGEMLSSLKLGMEAIWNSSDACMILLGDQPTIEIPVIGQVMQAFAEGRGRIILPSYNNRHGHPVLIDRSLWPAMFDLPDDAAPRDMIQAHRREVFHLPVDTDSILRDIDTPDDYNEEYRRRF